MHASKRNKKIKLVAISYHGKEKVFVVESAEFPPETWAHVALIYKHEGGSSWRLKISVNNQHAQGPFADPVCDSNLKSGNADPQETMSSFSLAEATVWYRTITQTEIESLYSSKASDGRTSQASLKTVLSQIKAEVMGESNLSEDNRLQLINEFKRHRKIIANDRSTITEVLALVSLYETYHSSGLFLNSATKLPHGLDREGASVDNLMFCVQQAALDFIYSSQNMADTAMDVLSGIKWKTARHFPGEVDPPTDPSLEHPIDVLATVNTFWGKKVRKEIMFTTYAHSISNIPSFCIRKLTVVDF